MHTSRRKWAPIVAALAVVSLGGTLLAFAMAQPAGQSDSDKHLHKFLRTIINTGADLFNQQRNFDGCARLYEETLITVRPLLNNHADLQKAIDAGLADAKSKTSPVERAFALRKVLDQVREGLAPTPPPSAKKMPGEEKPKGRRPETKKGPPVVTPKETKKEKTEPPKTATMWERLGGEKKVGKIVEDIIVTVAADPKVDVTRGGKYKIDEKKLKKQIVDLFSSLTGGPYKYTGKSMKDVHKGMGITNGQFDAFAADMKKVLDKNGVESADAAAIMKAVEATRKDIVEQPSSPPVQPKGKKGEDKKGSSGAGGEQLIRADLTTGSEKATHLEGAVRLQGKPLVLGYVTLQSETGRKFSTYLRNNGTYQFRTQLPAGNYHVAIENALDPTTNAPAKNTVAIPARYNNPATSGLTVSLQPGNQRHDFELTVQ